ncbi:MAG: ATPase domain-containing protein [Anaerolineae bacterium]|nr:ATPase [Anaerolineae bacterium]MDW8101367.1 ATPase domain-containing protein [Anaerolineae bacterium]
MKRVKTGIPGLDEMLSGGFFPASVNLVEGAPGTGKSTLGMQFIYNGIVKFDEPGLLITFEQFPEQYYRDAENFGWNFRNLEKEGKLRVIMTSPEIFRLDMERVSGMVEQAVIEMGARRIVIDSITHFERLTSDPVELRNLEYSLVNALKRLDLTAILTRESPTLLGGETGTYPLSYIVDSYILLRYVEIDSRIHKAILVLKFRGSDHAKDIRRFEITPNGIEILERFEGREGLMSGTPRRMAESFIEAFVRK